MNWTYTIYYYLPNMSRLFCQPVAFTTNDPSDYRSAVDAAHANGYEIVRVERVKRSLNGGNEK